MAQLGVDDMVDEALAQLRDRFSSERTKRLEKRPHGNAQFLNLESSAQFAHMSHDPWINPDEHTSIPDSIDLKQQIKYLIVGAGYGALLFAVRLIQAGVKVDEIVLVDGSGGFGGVWYWNRYPGIMCDIESHIYMPLLEETGYMPKHKYAYGPELRAHADRIADHWHLRPRTIFRQSVVGLGWDDLDDQWLVRTEFQGETPERDQFMRAKYIILAGGQLTHPKIPVVDGLADFQGHVFHTSRWNHGITGGSPDDAKPEMVGLQNMRVGIIGTGATAVQTVPRLAEYAKELYVIQRTPSSVDERNQRETDVAAWKEMTAEKGWWKARCKNFAAGIHDLEPQPVDLVGDRWTIGNPAYCTSWGYAKELRPDEVHKYIHQLHTGDAPRTRRVHARVEAIVQDKTTAEQLKHWYPTWCKRPCFHDEYLPAFNRANVTLVDTDGSGIERFSEKGVIVNGKELELDLLVLATGYGLSATFKSPAPASRFDINITGREGLNQDDEFRSEMRTLHGLCRNGFPNMFWMGSGQSSLTANQTHNINAYAEHVAYIITTAQKKSQSATPVVEATKEAEDDWGDQVAAAANGLAGMAGCTPSYHNGEGAFDLMASKMPEMRARMMRGQIWGRGINHYESVLAAWRAEGSMKGIEIDAE